MRCTVRPFRPHSCTTRPCPVPPSPEAIAQVYARFLDLKQAGRLPQSMTFEDYFWVWRSSRRGETFLGLDDGAINHGSMAEKLEAQLIDRPTKTLKGVIKTV